MTKKEGGLESVIPRYIAGVQLILRNSWTPDTKNSQYLTRNMSSEVFNRASPAIASERYCENEYSQD